MEFLESLREQKRVGEREFAGKQAEERERKELEEARRRAEEETQRRLYEEKLQRKAQQVYSTLPATVRQASSRGMAAAVILESFVDERPPSGEPHRQITVDRKAYYLKGWLIPFIELCREDGVPLTVVSEKVDVGLKGVLQRTYHVLAVDLKRL